MLLDTHMPSDTVQQATSVSAIAILIIFASHGVCVPCGSGRGLARRSCHGALQVCTSHSIHLIPAERAWPVSFDVSSFMPTKPLGLSRSSASQRESFSLHSRDRLNCRHRAPCSTVRQDCGCQAHHPQVCCDALPTAPSI